MTASTWKAAQMQATRALKAHRDALDGKRAEDAKRTMLEAQTAIGAALHLDDRPAPTDWRSR